MQLQENTVQGWSGVVNDLSTKQQAAKDHLNLLRKQKEELSLEAALGSADAKKKLDKINYELGRLALDAGDLDSAIRKAEEAKRQAAQAEAETAERNRHQQIGAHLEKYLAEVREIDKGLERLVEHFTSSRQALDAAESLMTSTESTPIQQLKSFFGPTLSAAHFGVGKYIELGATARHIIHRQPLARFAAGFCDRWLSNQEE
jgi:DNA repair exonuclease SbcCD ATPase subunit